MDNKQLSAAMRKSFQRLSAVTMPTDTHRLSEEDIKAIVLFGLTAPNIEPYHPVSEEEAKLMLEEVSASYSKYKMDGYLEDAQHKVMEAIIRPFGLAKVLFEDKEGGNVTTIHNANRKKPIYAEKSDEYNAADYRTHEYNKTARAIKENNTISPDELSDPSWTPDSLSKHSDDDYVLDRLSGKEIHPDQADVDHSIATEAYHKNGGFMQSKEQRRAFGADEGNLALTNKSGNRSMGSKDKKDWQPKEATDGSGKNNKEVHGQDNRRVNAALARGKATAEKHLPTNSEKMKYYSSKISKTGLKEGSKMGLQQAMGAFLMELSRAMWDEIRDVLASGVHTESNQSLLRAILERLKHVGSRVLSKWKEIAVAFKDGAISGFISNLVTVVINMFMTTAKNAVRMIREGFMSLVRGVKFILHPPEGFTKQEAFHEAGKLIIGGIAVGLGVLAEEAVTKGIALIPVIGPLIKPFADFIAPVLVGIAVGLGTSFLCYLWDKLDLFGAEEYRRHKFIIETLDKYQKESTVTADLAVAERNRLSAECDDLITAIEEIDKEFWALARS